MRVYIQAKNGVPIDYDHFIAYQGFREMGFETVFFETYEALRQSSLEDVVVGFIGTVRMRLADFNIRIEDMDYPACLSAYFGRNIWQTKINIVNSSPEMWPVFMKPVHNKLFKGRVIRSTKDLIGCGGDGTNIDVYCSDVVDFVSEYRSYILYDEILDVRRYGGDWSVCCNRSVIEACQKNFVNAPAAYALDFGVTKDGRTLLVEANNTCSIGSYGLDPALYARFISARWAELTQTVDECRF